MTFRLDHRSADFESGFALLLSAKRETQADVEQVVADILADVAGRGDAAVLEYTARFDRLSLTVEKLRIGQSDIEEASRECSPDVLAALDLAAARIEAFHGKQVPEPLSYQDHAGVRLGARWTPVEAVGIYVPGGLAAYPSSVLMNAIPAKIAGVDRIIMAVPTPDGVINPLVLAAAHRAGVHEIYRIGGAQAIAALAFGTSTVRRVDKIVGPGNAYVAAAKRQVFGRVGIDMIAGPSEILVVADRDNDPAWIAADLLSQAEHDEAAQAILITDDQGFAATVALTIEDHLTCLPRAAIARASWQEHGAIILVANLDDAVPLIDRIAPEHLELAISHPERLADRVRHAGAIFLGRHTPEAIGDYVAGPNHVLPTARSARFSSGLNLLDFMKRTTVVACDPASLARIGPAAVALAEAEGLDGHALSIKLRLGHAA